MTNKELCERYPYLIPRNVWTDEIDKDYDYSYIYGINCLPPGWSKLFLQMCEDIRQPLIDAGYLLDFRFSQIKEKYGTMRCYTFGAPCEVTHIIDMYEYVSQFVCEKCGKPACYQEQGWIGSYCADCMVPHDHVVKIEFDPIMRVERYKDGKSYKMEFDVTDIWRRLYELYS